MYASSTQNPAVKTGQTIRIIETYAPLHSWLEGAEFVLDRDTTLTSAYVPGEGWVTLRQWEIVPPEVHPDRYTMPDSTADMAAEIERLTKALTLEKLRHEETKQDRQNIIADFSIVSDALLEEAQNRGWCEEYDEFVDRVNRDTKRMDLQNCEVEYEVTVQRIRTVYEQVSVIVSGRRGISERDLRDSAFESAEMSYDWNEVDDDVSDEYEITDMNEV